MLRRATRSVVPRPAGAVTSALRFNALSGAAYRTGPFVNPVRRPQLSDEEREKVVINQDEWPAEFKNYDPQDPYRLFPDFIEGLNAFNLWLAGVEVAFIVVMWELVFYPSM